ncbi:galactokinase [Flagellimonas flava]|uniref:galactokinase n=1 Tax=Flagellimonas flava TaxID=570519 RepID=UPI003D65C4DE
MELLHKVKRNYKAQFSDDPIMVKASGRINLIGEHVDYNDGFVFPAAIDKGIIVAIGRNEDSCCYATALDFEETYRFGLDEVSKQNNGGWRNYLLGIIHELQKRFLPLGNFNMVFAGDIPAGSGLSSSAALENSIVFAINTLFDLGLCREEMVKISQKAEHEFVGVQCGIMDQYASMFGKKDNFLLLDCKSLDVVSYEADFDSHELVLINTNVQHTLSDSAYNDRRNVCEKISSMLGKKALRNVSEEELTTLSGKITLADYQKAQFVIQEIQRTQRAAICLENKDMAGLGNLLFSSHEGLSKEYQVSCDELDFLVDMAREDNGVIGARMMGGGFGGCTINLVKKGEGQNYIEKVEMAYKNKFGVTCSVYHVSISDGTYLLNE